MLVTTTLVATTQSMLLTIIGLFLIIAAMDAYQAIARAWSSAWEIYSAKRERRLYEQKLSVGTIGYLRAWCVAKQIHYENEWTRNKLYELLTA